MNSLSSAELALSAKCLGKCSICSTRSKMYLSPHTKSSLSDQAVYKSLYISYIKYLP